MSSPKGYHAAIETRISQGEGSRRRIVRLVVAVFLSGAGVVHAACGGSQGAEPSFDAGVDDAFAVDPDPCAASQSFEYKTIATFESAGTAQYTGPADAGPMAGQYATYVSCDLTGPLFQAGRPVTGLSNDSCTTGYTETGERLLQKRCGADPFGMHLQAGELTGWGMNVGIDLRQNCNNTTDPAYTAGNGPCYVDASQWDGISFWAYLGSPSVGTTLLLTVGDPQTAGVLGGTYPFNQLDCGNPACVAGIDAGMDCTPNTQPLCLCDPYGKGVGLSNQWQFYAVPFADLRQKGYGKPEAALDVAHLLSVKFSLSAGPWDVWIDDVALYRQKKP